MKGKIIAVLSLAASVVLLASLWMTNVQSITTNPQIPTEWYETYPSIIITEMWNWDWTGYTTEVPWPGGDMLYKRVGETVFFTLPPNTSVMLAYRDEQSSTFVFRGGETAMGGPDMAHLMMFNGTCSITFTNADIPSTDHDNNYKGLRLLVEAQIDLYGILNVSEGDYLWRGLVHQHIVLWAPKGSPA